MSRSTTAALISLLVFPGTGHLYLKRRTRALVFIVPTAVAAVYFVIDATERATDMMNQIMSGSMGMDPAAIAAKLAQAGPTSFLVDLAKYVILAGWIAAAVDAWLLGRPPRPQ